MIIGLPKLEKKSTIYGFENILTRYQPSNGNCQVFGLENKHLMSFPGKQIILRKCTKIIPILSSDDHHGSSERKEMHHTFTVP